MTRKIPFAPSSAFWSGMEQKCVEPTRCEEGLQEFTQFAPNVVLSDIGMPEHDGYELIAHLRKLPGGPPCPRWH